LGLFFKRDFGAQVRLDRPADYIRGELARAWKNGRARKALSDYFNSHGQNLLLPKGVAFFYHEEAIYLRGEVGDEFFWQRVSQPELEHRGFWEGLLNVLVCDASRDKTDVLSFSSILLNWQLSAYSLSASRRCSTMGCLFLAFAGTITKS